MQPKISIIIPSFKSKGKLGIFVEELYYLSKELKNICILKILIIDDCCPYKSFNEISIQKNIRIIKNHKNIGVGASTIVGLREALNEESDFFIKMDADGQHPAKYLKELIPYLLTTKKYELFLVKGSRFSFISSNTNIPIMRRIGSFCLEPIARAALSYKGLTDIANGFISMNKITLKYLLSKKINNKFEDRFLFESSVLRACSNIGINIHEFPMETIYGKEWTSSMKSHTMIYPLLVFWFKSLLKRILFKYIYKLNLGSLFLISSLINCMFSILTLLISIIPSINRNEYVSAGNASGFIFLLLSTIVLLSLFVLYDYFSKKPIKTIFFESFYE